MGGGEGGTDIRPESPPPPCTINGIEEWEVRNILRERVEQGERQYEVEWVGFPGRTWEPASGVTNTLALACFKRRGEGGDGGEGRGKRGKVRVSMQRYS